MIRAVLTYPHPILKRACEPVGRDRALAVLEDLVDTMRAHPGCVGLAACQIGEPVRVAVVDVSTHRAAHASHGLIAIVNPVLELSADRAEAREGCLSLPTITADVARASRLIVTTTREADRPPERLWSAGFEARAIQHEVDHLDGILVLDRVTSAHGIHLRKNVSRAGPPGRLP